MTLPAGWSDVPLGILGATIRDSIRPSVGSHYELYSVPAFAQGVPEILDGAEIGSLKRQVLPHDLLVCKINPRINRVWSVGPRDSLQQIASPEWVILRTHDPALTAFLRYQLTAAPFRRWIERDVHGVTGSHTRAKDYHILAFSVSLAPAVEQHRIVVAIEEATSKLDAGEAGLRKARRLLKRLRDAVLAAAVTGRLVAQDSAEAPTWGHLASLGVEPANPENVPSLPAHWEWATLGSIADVVGGVTKDAKRQDDPAYVERPYLRVANVQRGYLDLDVVATIRVPPTKAIQLALRPGDVLFNEGGDRDKLGRGWVWEGQIPECIHQNHVFRARITPGVEPKLVSLWGNTFGRGWFEGRGKQTTNLASLNLTTLKSFPVPIPPHPEQCRIVAEVERQLSFIDACERAVDAGIARSAALRRSVLKAAFEGRLVPQDPSDEPVSVLLDRIKAERANSGAGGRRGRRKAESS